MSAGSDTVAIQNWLQRLADGDESAREQLIQSAENRLLCLTRKMLRTFPTVRRWEQTDDVFQNSVLRIHRSLAVVMPKTVADFMRFAAMVIRRELIDLSRHYGGPLGMGRKYESDSNLQSQCSGLANGLVADGDECSSLMWWAEFHQAVESLPTELAEVTDLIWYQDLSQSQVAELLNISVRTVQRRWLESRLKLHASLGTLPQESIGD